MGLALLVAPLPALAPPRPSLRLARNAVALNSGAAKAKEDIAERRDAAVAARGTHAARTAAPTRPARRPVVGRSDKGFVAGVSVCCQGCTSDMLGGDTAGDMGHPTRRCSPHRVGRIATRRPRLVLPHDHRMRTRRRRPCQWSPGTGRSSRIIACWRPAPLASPGRPRPLPRPALAGATAQSPDHDPRVADANGRGGIGDQPGTAAASRRSVAPGARQRSTVGGVWLAWQVQQYQPGRATDRVAPSTRETVTIILLEGFPPRRQACRRGSLPSGPPSCSSISQALRCGFDPLAARGLPRALSLVQPHDVSEWRDPT